MVKGLWKSVSIWWC